MLNSLQAGRAIAAIMVLLHHAAPRTSAFVEQMPASVSAALYLGYLGVDFFFVLSGFIVYYTTASRPNQGATGLAYAQGRLLRIMVPYLPIGIGIALLYITLPDPGTGSRDWSWFSTLTLFPTDRPPALSVAWTLQHELVFYGLYAAMFFSGRLWTGLVIWAAAIASAEASGLALPPLLRTALDPINLEFIFGIIAAWWVHTGRATPAAATFAAAGLCLLLWVGLGAERDQSFLVGLGIAVLIPTLIRTETAGRFTVPQSLVFLGAASYAIYLVHNLALSFASRAVSIMGVTDWLAGLVASAAMAIAAGVLYYLALERPAMSLARSATRRVPARG